MNLGYDYIRNINSVNMLSRQLSSTRISAESKNKIVVLGTGWGGFRVAKDLDKNQFDVTVISPRNHFLFTPLLPSTSVGTLEFRCVQEPVRTIADIHYHQAQANKIDFKNQIVSCSDVYSHYQKGKPLTNLKTINFEVPYDKLIIACGTKSNTFETPGLKSLEEERIGKSGTNKHNVFFLKQLEHSNSIRNRIIECFERASSPFITTEECNRILTFVVVGGGPTSIEFASELCDFLQNDVAKWYHDLQARYKVVIVEASNTLLGSFDASLSGYVKRQLASKNVIIQTGQHVVEVKDVSVILKSGEEIAFGICIWSTGNKATNFVSNLGVPFTSDQRIQIDDYLKVVGKDNVYAIGDCAANHVKPLAMLAQVANQQGIHLAKSFNKGKNYKFQYKFLGSMVSLGTFKAVVELGSDVPQAASKIKGFIAFLLWRSAYWSMSVSIANKILIPMFWFKSFFFGRDISKF